MSIAEQASGTRPSRMPVIFMICILIPAGIYLGPLRLSPYRLLLLGMFIPALIGLFSGKVGRVRGFDILILLAFAWAALALFVNHGGAATETAGILYAEAIGAYLIGRVYIRNAADYGVFARALFFAVIFMFPFAVYEIVTGQPILLDLLRKAVPTHSSIVQDKRLGMERAQVLFEHSILYGAFIATAYGPIHYVINSGKGMGLRIGTYTLGFLATLFSVSGGALVALFFQIALFFWDTFTRFLKRRWTVLGLFFVMLYIAIDVGTYSNPFEVFVRYLAFSQGSGYNRILIWRFGTENIANNPIFGLGMGMWVAPAWMNSSVDNFWLLMAMRYGMPMFLMFVFAVLWIVRAASLTDMARDTDHRARAAFLTSLGGMILAGCTVHYWNELFVWFMFILGTGGWATRPHDDGASTPDPEGTQDSPTHRRAALPYSRPVPAAAQARRQTHLRRT